jgi:hypothetical protein
VDTSLIRILIPGNRPKPADGCPAGGEAAVDGRQDLPGDGHGRCAAAITESDRIRWSWYRQAVLITGSDALAMSFPLVACPNRRS